jgi:iron complex outermembrane receptor protein
MNRTLKLALMAGSAVASISFPALAFAAEATDSTHLEEVVVTAEKREQNVKDVPQSVTALSGTKLDVLRATTFEDYITQVPGAILVSSQPGSSRLVLRGINTGGVSSTIATYVDETPYGSVTGLANGAVLAPDLDTFDMQRVEVLRGPQGTLYGASSLGGLLKYVTNPPDPSHYAGKIEVDGTDTDHGGLGGSVKGVFNAPLGDRAAIRIGGYYDEEAGFINDPLRNADRVNENK